MPDVHLRLAEEGDVAFLMALRNDIETQHLLLAHPDGPADEDAVRSWISRRNSEPGGLFRVIVSGFGEHLGFVQIANVHRSDRYGSLGLALANSARGRGCGTSALAAALREASGALGLRKIVLHVRADNRPALAMYARSEFRTVGVLKQHYAESASHRHDVVLMEKILFLAGVA